jgi:uncharacterized phage protein (TIGR01671 family)
MMREILFRGKRMVNGEWVQGYVYQIWESVYILWGMTNGIPNMIEVIPETVGQYTGLTDKHGVKIFEGDIVKLDKDVKQTFEIDDGTVQFGRGGFYVKEFGLLNSLNTLASYDWVLRGEVIGNIHEQEEQ